MCVCGGGSVGGRGGQKGRVYSRSDVRFDLQHDGILPSTSAY